MEFRRDRVTWIAYVLLAWFAYLQAAPGLVIVHLRDELDLSYSTGGLHSSLRSRRWDSRSRVAAHSSRRRARRSSCDDPCSAAPARLLASPPRRSMRSCQRNAGDRATQPSPSFLRGPGRQAKLHKLAPEPSRWVEQS
jgi:hypothetical protein